MTPDAAPVPPYATAPATDPARPKNKVGIAALILILVAAAIPLVIVVGTWISAAVDFPGDVDNVVYVGLIGGAILGFGAFALVSPIALVAAVLGVVSLGRPGSKVPGILALIFGVLGAFGLFGLPVVLGEIVPGW